MMQNRRIAVTLGIVALLAGVGVAQVTVQPPGGVGEGGTGVIVAPPTAPAPTPVTTQPLPTTIPRISPTATLPSAESVLQSLLNSGSSSAPASTVVPAPAATGTAGAPPAGAAAGSHVLPQTEAVAPREPAAIRLREGDYISKRLGRLVKDSSGNELIVFDGDGKAMSDPPMGVVPCDMLAKMEDLSDYGAKPVKFTISGTVTQYRGRNYLYVMVAIQVKDLNQGIGTGQTDAGLGR